MKDIFLFAFLITLAHTKIANAKKYCVDVSKYIIYT